MTSFLFVWQLQLEVFHAPFVYPLSVNSPVFREEPKYVPNGNGYTTKVTEPVALNVWAYFRQLSGKEIFAAAAYRYDEEVLFTINYRAGLTTACYVEYGGVKYSVTRIDTFEGYKQDITLYCKRM